MDDGIEQIILQCSYHLLVILCLELLEEFNPSLNSNTATPKKRIIRESYVLSLN